MWYVVQKSPQSLLQIMKPSQQSAAVSRCQQNAPDSDLLQPPIQTSWMLPEHLPRTGLLQTPQVRLGGKLDRYRSKMKVKWLIYPPRGYLLEYNGLEQPNKECIAKLMPPGKKKKHPTTLHLANRDAWTVLCWEKPWRIWVCPGYPKNPLDELRFYGYPGIPICKYARMYGQQERFNGNLFCDAGPNGLVWSIPNCSCRIFFQFCARIYGSQWGKW